MRKGKKNTKSLLTHTPEKTTTTKKIDLVGHGNTEAEISIADVSCLRVRECS